LKLNEQTGKRFRFPENFCKILRFTASND